MQPQSERDQAIQKLGELIEKIRIATLTTITEDGRLWSRPITTQRAKFDGDLWFITKRGSPKVQEVRRHPRVSLSYVRTEDNTYVCLSGTAEVLSNVKKAEELWDPSYLSWFPGGPGDPSLVLIRVSVERAEYWEAPALTWPFEAGFVALGPEQRDNPMFHAKISISRKLNPEASAVFTPARFGAVLFDLDGVLTSTARVHAACWKQTFDDFLQTRSARTGEPFRPFDVEDDYKRYVDGKPRYDGVRSFLASRSITLPEGTPDSPPDEESVCGVGNRKDELVKQAIRAGKAETYPNSIAFVRWVRGLGLKTAVVSSSRNCTEVLQAVGIEELFEARVDGVVVDHLHLPGKPAPDTYLHAAELVGVTPPRAVVVEDAIAGVQAGRAGGFGLVVGVDRGGGAEGLRQNGADLVVSDLGELLDKPEGGHPR